MGEFAQARDVGEFVAGAVARTEGRAADVDGVGTVLDGLDARSRRSRPGRTTDRR